MSAPLKVGMLGTRGIARNHMTPYLTHPEQVRMTAVCDMVEPLAREYAKDAGVEDVYTDFDDMLRNADIDAVDICTNHAAHAPCTIAAVRAGKHVLVEKAMANTLQACRDMVEAADKAGVTLMIAHQLRHSREANAVKRFIDEGHLGEIQAVRTHVTMGGPKRGWMCDAEPGGGVLQLNSIHHIDLLRYYVGNVKRVMGVCKSAQPHMVNGAEDVVAATLELENGAIGGLFASWTTDITPERAAYLLFGTKGTVHSTPPVNPRSRESPTSHFGTIMHALKDPDENLDRRNDADLQRLRHPPFDVLPTREADQPTVNLFVNEVLHFAECVRTGKEPTSSGRDNIESMKVVFAICESSRTGRAVDLADL